MSVRSVVRLICFPIILGGNGGFLGIVGAAIDPVRMQMPDSGTSLYYIQWLYPRLSASNISRWTGTRYRYVGADREVIRVD